MSAQAAVAGQIHALTENWDNPAVERAIFGTADPAQIAAYVDAFCREHLGAGIAEALFYRSSIGSVFGLGLEDGQRVVVKAHQPDYPAVYLGAVQRVARHLASRGFPCPVPILDPTRMGLGTATAETFIGDGECRNAHEPEVRQAIACALWRQIDLAREFVNLPGIGELQAQHPVPPERLFGKPHSVIFDFEATAAGAEWIDELGWRAKRLLSQPVGEMVIGHSDWSAKHFLFVEGAMRVIYDWDSLRVDPEPVIVGRAAHAFCAVYDTPLDGKVLHTPSYEDVVAFVAEYQAARGVAFTPAERRAVGAACTYSIAYSSRCSHALDPRPGRDAELPPGDWRHALASYGERLLTW